MSSYVSVGSFVTEYLRWTCDSRDGVSVRGKPCISTYKVTCLPLIITKEFRIEHINLPYDVQAGFTLLFSIIKVLLKDNELSNDKPELR